MQDTWKKQYDTVRKLLCRWIACKVGNKFTMDAFLDNNDFVKMELKTLCTVFSNVFLCSLHIINGSLKFGMTCIQVDEGKII